MAPARGAAAGHGWGMRRAGARLRSRFPWHLCSHPRTRAASRPAPPGPPRSLASAPRAATPRLTLPHRHALTPPGRPAAGPLDRRATSPLCRRVPSPPHLPTSRRRAGSSRATASPPGRWVAAPRLASLPGPPAAPPWRSRAAASPRAAGPPRCLDSRRPVPRAASFRRILERCGAGLNPASEGSARALVQCRALFRPAGGCVGAWLRSGLSRRSFARRPRRLHAEAWCRAGPVFGGWGGGCGGWRAASLCFRWGDVPSWACVGQVSLLPL
jgi:hypothetical protein